MNLAQLLRLDSYTSDQFSDTRSVDQESMGQLDIRSIESPPDQRLSAQIPQQTLQSRNMTHQAELTAENRRRRNRNMTLAAQNRLLSYGGDTGQQAPSISTRQVWSCLHFLMMHELEEVTVIVFEV